MNIKEFFSHEKIPENWKECDECGSEDIDIKAYGNGESWIVTCNKCGNLIDED